MNFIEDAIVSIYLNNIHGNIYLVKDVIPKLKEIGINWIDLSDCDSYAEAQKQLNQFKIFVREHLPNWFVIANSSGLFMFKFGEEEFDKLLKLITTSYGDFNPSYFYLRNTTSFCGNYIKIILQHFINHLHEIKYYKKFRIMASPLPDQCLEFYQHLLNLTRQHSDNSSIND